MDKVKLACDRARADIPLTLNEGRAVAARVAELESAKKMAWDGWEKQSQATSKALARMFDLEAENKALKAAQQPRPMSEARTDKVLLVCDTFIARRDQSTAFQEGQTAVFAIVTGWLPRTPEGGKAEKQNA